MRSSSTFAGALALAALSLAPAAADAQYTAPPPDPGFSYIFDGTADGVRRVVRQVGVRRRHGGAVAPGVRGWAGPGDARPRRGLVPGRRLAVRRLLVPGPRRSATRCSASSTRCRTPRPRRRNGGIMVRTPEVRYTGRRHGRRPGPEADRLQLRRSARARCWSATATTPGASRRRTRGRARAVRSRRRRTPRTRRSSTRAPTARAPATTTSTTSTARPADGQRQRQQPPALDAGLLRPRDPDQRVADRRRAAPVDRTRSRPARSTASATSTPSSRAPTSA